MKTSHLIKQNIRVHNQIYDNYELLHTEIFNPKEQERLHSKLVKAIKSIRTDSSHKIALDYGCGSGNLTKHLIDSGVCTVASDVSERFLELVESKYSNTGKLSTLKINGQDLSNIENDSFDLIAVYSVLHHVPDYLQIVKEMIRVLKKGGIIYLDHECNDSYWIRSKEYIEFLQLVQLRTKKSWKRYIRLSNYINKVRQIINHRFSSEGDIHVWPNDHIEWVEIENILLSKGCEIVLKEDYLLYRINYPIDIYLEYKNKCNDMRVLIARKR